MSELEAGLDELASGRGSLYLLTGEPGIGKSRLADEIGRVATARGVSVHWGRAWEAGGAPAYWPVIQVLRGITGEADPLPALVTPTRTPMERFQLFDSVVALLRARTEAARLLVLDDLHAADASSLELLQFLVRELRELPIMVIGTYRDAEIRLDRDRTQLLGRVAREATTLALTRLDRADVATFVTLATGLTPDEARVARIFQQTEGNPLFLRELLRLHGETARGSDSIREVVRARLALLDRDARLLLEAASVIGREFTLAPLVAITKHTELDVRALVEPAANAGIVEALDHPPRWRFTHVLLRQGLYDDLADAQRCAFHAAVADDLAHRSSTELAEIAHHRVHAVPLVSAADAALAAQRAGDRAIDLLAFEHAHEHYATAERLLATDAEQRRARFEAILGCAHASMRMAEVRQGRAECDRAATIARELGDGELFARAALMATYELVPEIREPDIIAALEEALQRLPAGDGALRAQCLAQLAAQRHPEPDNAPRIALARDAVEMARRLGDPEALRRTLAGASIAITVYADLDEADEIHEELLRLSVAAGDKRVALRTHLFLAGVGFQRGDRVGVARHYAAVRELVAGFGHGRFGWMTESISLVEALVAGRFDEAQRGLELARSTAAQDEARGGLFVAAPLAFACVMERYDQVEQIEADVRAAFAPITHELASCIAEMLIAQLHGRAGNRDRARAQLAAVQAMPMFSRIEEPAWLAFLADACCLTDERDLAERLYVKILPHANRFGFLGPLTLCIDPPYSRQLGLLAHTLGRLDDAISHLEHALGLTRQAGMRAHEARLELELARALGDRGGIDDLKRADDLRASANALARELGQVGLLSAAAAVPAAPAFASPLFTIAREGDAWRVTCGARTIALRDTRGMQLLAQLVATPDHELHVLQLVSGDADVVDRGDAGPLLDPTAVNAYRQRLLALRDELEEAERFSDFTRAERARAQIESITDELARGVGLGGRERRAVSAAERARTAIQKRLREAIRKIAAEIPELGRHLEQTIYTGTFCGYLPHGRVTR